MSRASNYERQMLELINAERAAAGLNPVALELRLNDSSEVHSRWMLEQNQFSHEGANGNNPGDRMRDANFDFSGNWSFGENIAYQSERGAPGLEDDVEDLHNSLMNSPGHRANILNPEFEVVGLGIEVGDYDGFEAVMVTQNFASTDGEVLIDDPAATPDPDTDDPDTPDTDEPNPDTPDPETPDTDEPDTDEPDTDEPDTDEPDTDEPDTDEPDPVMPEIDEPGPTDEEFRLSELETLLNAFFDELEDQFSFNFEVSVDDDSVSFWFDFNFSDDEEVELVDSDGTDLPNETDPVPFDGGIEFDGGWDCMA
ncbi:MAG: CAP domain-containing protein [Pseudomonadota bacterium]